MFKFKKKKTLCASKLETFGFNSKLAKGLRIDASVFLWIFIMCILLTGAIGDEGFKLLHSFWYFGVLSTSYITLFSNTLYIFMNLLFIQMLSVFVLWFENTLACLLVKTRLFAFGALSNYVFLHQWYNHKQMFPNLYEYNH